jgi:translation initiation factor 1 (eIF-1/SUI1)
LKDQLDKLFGVSESYEFLGKETSKIYIYTEMRKRRKIVTIIKGIYGNESEIKNLLKTMKKKFGCGGTYDFDQNTKTYTLELQGDHRIKVYALLKQIGYKDIEVT